MTTDNIFSGLKVVDLASFIAGPGAAVILSDFGADVIKVEPPSGDTWRIGYKIPPQPRAQDNYPWHLNNRNKRGLALNLKSPDAGEVLERLVKWADVLIPADLRRHQRLRRQGTRRRPPRLRHHVVLGTEWAPVADARRGSAAHPAPVRQRRSRDRGRAVLRDRDGPLPA